MFGQAGRGLSIFLMSMMLLLLPAMVGAEPDQVNAAPPPIGQQVIREGDFAVKLARALSVGTAQDEIEAENQLTQVGIMPKNGWIADYPVTPDIVDELYKAVRDAAASNKIPLSVDAAFQRLNDVMVQAGLSIETPSSDRTVSAEPAAPQSYPSSTVINNYYQNEGPPTVTYYAPPPDYYYMYGWVPSPFWSVGIWFPGFFILNDFHRTLFIDNRVVFVSNHFNDLRRRRIVRIDPVTRFNGSAIANTRVVHGRGGDPAIGASRVRAISNEPRMNAPRMQGVPSSPAVRRPLRNDTVVNTPRSSSVVGLPANSGTRFSMPSRGNRTMGIQTRSEAVVGTPSVPPRMVRSFIPPAGSSGVFNMPSRGNREMSMPSRGGGFFDRSFSRGSNAFGGRGRR